MAHKEGGNYIGLCQKGFLEKNINVQNAERLTATWVSGGSRRMCQLRGVKYSVLMCSAGAIFLRKMKAGENHILQSILLVMTNLCAG